MNIIRESPDGLAREVWDFYVDGHAHALKVQLVGYRRERWASRRHKKYETLGTWTAHASRFERERPSWIASPPVLAEGLVLEAIRERTVIEWPSAEFLKAQKVGPSPSPFARKPRS
jgi:hypothetical protein